MISKQVNKITKVSNKEFTLYHLDNSPNSLRKGQPNACCIAKNTEQCLPLSRKMQNMRHVMKKLQEIQKACSVTNCPVTKMEGCTSINEKEQDKSYLVNKFIKSKRLMITSSTIAQQSLKNGMVAKGTHRRLKSNTKEDAMSIADKQFDKMQQMMREKQKLLRFFEKTAINFRNRNNPFEPVRRVLSAHKPSPAWVENKQNFKKPISSK